MRALPVGPPARSSHTAADPEAALEYAIQHIRGNRVEIIEGIMEPVSPTWPHERALTRLRRRLDATMDGPGLEPGAGDLDLPGSPNRYIPDLAAVPSDLVDRHETLLPSHSLLVVEAGSDSDAGTDRIVEPARYAEYGAPLDLLVDRREKACTLFSGPGEPGYTRADGPHPFGAPVQLPEPFGLSLDTAVLKETV